MKALVKKIEGAIYKELENNQYNGGFEICEDDFHVESKGGAYYITEIEAMYFPEPEDDRGIEVKIDIEEFNEWLKDVEADGKATAETEAALTGYYYRTRL